MLCSDTLCWHSCIYCVSLSILCQAKSAMDVGCSYLGNLPVIGCIAQLFFNGYLDIVLVPGYRAQEYWQL